MAKRQTAARPPLDRAALSALPLGAVKPRGWLRDQLRLQADGFTGGLPAVWPDVGETSGWLGGPGESWERGPYYCDGLIPLAHLLEDARLLARAQRWVDWSLASQREDGFFGPANNPDWWPRMVMLKVLTQHAEAADDGRVLPFLERYLAHLAGELPGRPLEKWGQARGAENAGHALGLFLRREPSQQTGHGALRLRGVAHQRQLRARLRQEGLVHPLAQLRVAPGRQ